MTHRSHAISTWGAPRFPTTAAWLHRRAELPCEVTEDRAVRDEECLRNDDPRKGNRRDLWSDVGRGRLSLIRTVDDRHDACRACAPPLDFQRKARHGETRRGQAAEVHEPLDLGIGQ